MSIYEYNDNTQLTEHFNIQEFACGCGNHNILHNPYLSNKLEKLRSKLNCSKIIITSGYRCKDYDLSIGGYGGGCHVSGDAADICCYDHDGNKISSKIVSCVAQDLGFGGIANITSDYCYTHVDVRTNNFWYGDEQVTSSYSVTDDFYKYYGIDRNKINTEKQTKNNTVLKGIDLSYCQTNIEWDKVNTDFVLIRAGYGRELNQKDSMFDSHYSNCKKNNIPCGTYWYSYATTVEEAIQEAKVCLQIIKDKQFEFPIFYDIEEQSQFVLGKDAVSKIFKAFCDTLEKENYFVGLYMSASPLNDYITDKIKNNYPIWVANYGVSKPIYNGDYGIWQYSDGGKVSGINGDVDLNYCYVDYPEIIKRLGFNGYTAVQPTSTKKVKIEIDGETYEGDLTKI